MSASQSQDRLRQLQEIEKVRRVSAIKHGVSIPLHLFLETCKLYALTSKEIVMVVSNAGHALKEISKEIPSEETFKTYTQQFLNSLQVKLKHGLYVFRRFQSFHYILELCYTYEILSTGFGTRKYIL